MLTRPLVYGGRSRRREGADTTPLSGVFDMALILEIMDRSGKERTYYLKLFSGDTPIQINKSFAAEILARYSCKKYEPDPDTSDCATAYKIAIFKIEGENIYLSYEGLTKEGEPTYTIRFSEAGEEMNLEEDVYNHILGSYRLELAHPKDVRYNTPRSRVFLVRPQKRAAKDPPRS